MLVTTENTSLLHFELCSNESNDTTIVFLIIELTGNIEPHAARAREHSLKNYLA